MPDSIVEIIEVDNGWIIKTNHACFGSKRQKVFTKWPDVIKCIEIALRIKNEDSK